MADRGRTPARPTVVIRGGTVVDETGERRADVVADGGTVVAVGADLAIPSGATVLDAGGCLVAPGLVDLHTHLRQPGREEAETVETAARGAALGGYTAVVGMPNTDPPIDNAAVALEVLGLGATTACRAVPNPSAANNAQNPSGRVNPALFGSQASGVPAWAARLVIQHTAAANTPMIERLKVIPVSGRPMVI